MPSFSSKPFIEALQRLQGQSLLPTSAGTYDLEQLPADIRERSFFAARVINANILQQGYDLITRGVGGGERDASGNYVPGSSVNMATFRLEMKKFLDSISYQPEAGQEGTLKDLSSDKRLEVIWKTNVEMAQGYGAYVKQQDPAALDAWPAQELYRLEDRKERRPWGQRWNDAIQQIGRSNTSAIPVGDPYADSGMFALVNDQIWTTISRFDLPYPPYDFGSGMWIRAVSRLEAENMGLLDAGDAAPDPALVGFNQGVQADVTDLAPALLAALSAFGKVVDGVFHMMANRSAGTDVIANFSQGQPRDSLGRWVDANGGGLSERHNIARGKRAMRRALRQQTDVSKAMFRKEIGQIDFEWGTPGIKADDWNTGKGIRHILKKHPDAVMKIPAAIAKGTIKHDKEDSQKRVIEHEDMRIVVVKTNSRKGWLLSGYSRRKVRS